MKTQIHSTGAEEDSAQTKAALDEMFAAMRKADERGDAAREALLKAAPALVRALKINSGQSKKVRVLIWSVWNASTIVALGECLCGLDTDIAEAVAALIAARVHLGGDADELIRPILEESGEMDACERFGDTFPENEDFVYPMPLQSVSELRSLVSSLEAVQSRRVL